MLSQLALICVSVFAGRNAQRLGRKPVFAAGLIVLIARGLLFGLTLHRPDLFVAVEALDGLAGGVYDVIWVIVAAKRGLFRASLDLREVEEQKRRPVTISVSEA